MFHEHLVVQILTVALLVSINKTLVRHIYKIAQPLTSKNFVPISSSIPALLLPPVLQLRQNFSSDETSFVVRTFHGYYYQTAVMPPNTTLVQFRPHVASAAIVNGRAVSRIFVNGTEIYDATFTSNLTLNSPGPFGWPHSADSIFNVTVLAEDAVSMRSYLFKVRVAPDEPDNQTFWAPFFMVNATNVSQAWYPERNAFGVNYAGDLSANLTLLANTSIGLMISVNDTKWQTDVASVIPGLLNDYFPIRAMNFTPATLVDGGPWTPINQTTSNGTALRTLYISGDGNCQRSFKCKFGRCVPLTWIGNPDPTIHRLCGKNVTLFVQPTTVGNTSLGALVSDGNPIGGPLQYRQEYVNISLANSTITIADAILNGDGSITAVWSVPAVLNGKDYFGNQAVNNDRAPLDQDLKVMVCPPLQVAGQQDFVLDFNGTSGPCLCGQDLGCVKPLFGNVTSLANGYYALDLPLLRAGTNQVAVILPLNKGLGGVRSQLDNLNFNTSSLGGVNATTPFFAFEVVPDTLGLGSRIEVTDTRFSVEEDMDPFVYIRVRDNYGNWIAAPGACSASFP